MRPNDELFKVTGLTIGYVKKADGSMRKVFEKENTIEDGLKELARDIITDDSNGAASGKSYGERDLFSAEADNSSGGMGVGLNGEDGIILDDGTTQFAMKMEGAGGGDYHPSDAVGEWYRQVRGTFAYDDYAGTTALGSPQEFDSARFGTNFDIDANGEDDGDFLNLFATQSLSGVSISSGDTFILDWKITIS